MLPTAHYSRALDYNERVNVNVCNKPLTVFRYLTLSLLGLSLAVETSFKHGIQWTASALAVCFTGDIIGTFHVTMQYAKDDILGLGDIIVWSQQYKNQ